MRRGNENLGSSYAVELAHASWAETDDRESRTRNAREAMEAKWLAKAGGNRKRAESMRKAHYARMARLSVEARRKKREI